MTAPSNLISGSIWARSKPNNESSYSMVLCVTNEGLPERVLEKNTQQVIFVTEQGKVLSMGVEDFCAKRHYETFDVDAAAAFEALINLLKGDDDSADDQPTIDSVVADETLFAKDQPEPEPGASSEDEESASSLALNVGPHPLANILRKNLVLYTESPFYTGDTLHTLKFVLSDALSLASLREAFTISDPNAVQKFELVTATETFQVGIDAFVDVLLEADQWANYGCLYVTSQGDFRSPSEEVAVATQEDDVVDLSVTAVTGVTTTISVS